jgi:hypothetical protein
MHRVSGANSYLLTSTKVQILTFFTCTKVQILTFDCSESQALIHSCVCWCIRTYADVCSRMRVSGAPFQCSPSAQLSSRQTAYSDVCRRMLTYAGADSKARLADKGAVGAAACARVSQDDRWYGKGETYADVCWRMLTYADVGGRMLTYADVCWRMLTYARAACARVSQDYRWYGKGGGAEVIWC